MLATFWVWIEFETDFLMVHVIQIALRKITFEGLL